MKNILAETQGIPKDAQRLVFAGKEIDHDYGVALSKYGITKEATLHLVLRLRGGMPKKPNTSTSVWKPKAGGWRSRAAEAEEMAAEEAPASDEMPTFLKLSAPTLDGVRHCLSDLLHHAETHGIDVLNCVNRAEMLGLVPHGSPPVTSLEQFQELVCAKWESRDRSDPTETIASLDGHLTAVVRLSEGGTPSSDERLLTAFCTAMAYLSTFAALLDPMVALSFDSDGAYAACHDCDSGFIVCKHCDSRWGVPDPDGCMMCNCDGGAFCACPHGEERARAGLTLCQLNAS